MDDLQFGCQVVSYGDVARTVAQAVRAEEAGFDLLTLPDHLFHPTGSEEYLVEPPWEVFTVLGAITTRTRRVGLMPGVADSVRRHPTELAHAVATLDRLSGGRAGLGIGAGEAFNLAPIGDLDWSKPYTRFREAVTAIDGLWSSTEGEPFDFEGEFFELEDAHMGLKPTRDPPLWVGGHGPRMRALTGRVADGWLPWIYSPDAYESDLIRVLDAAVDAGRDPTDLDRAVMIPTTVYEDGDAARADALSRNRVNLALRPPLLEAMGYPEIADDAPVIWRTTFDEEGRDRLGRVAERIPDEAVEAVSVVGDPEEAIARIERFLDAGVNRPVLVPVGDFEEIMTRYEEDVFPHFS